MCGLVRPLIASAKKSSVVSVRRYCHRNASSFRRTSAIATGLWAARCMALNTLASPRSRSITPVKWRRKDTSRYRSRWLQASGEARSSSLRRAAASAQCATCRSV